METSVSSISQVLFPSWNLTARNSYLGNSKYALVHSLAFLIEMDTS